MNYIKAADVQKLLIDPKQTLLSKRGSALLDDRSNMMFVKDTPSRLDDVRTMIAKVDTPVRQVMIEARIVEAGDSLRRISASVWAIMTKLAEGLRDCGRRESGRHRLSYWPVDYGPSLVVRFNLCESPSDTTSRKCRRLLNDSVQQRQDGLP